MKRLLLLWAGLLVSAVAFSQLLTWTPPFPVEDDPAQSLVITVDASKGNAGLLNYATTSDVYVHTGVITSQSTGPGNWRYVKFNQNFSQPNAQLQAQFIGNNRWRFTITGSLKAYYGVPAGETILRIAILFRNGAGTTVQRNTDGSDMYVPVYGPALAVRFTDPATEPRFVPVPERQTWTLGSSINLAAAANRPAALKLYHNGNLVNSSAGNATSLTGTSSITVVGNQQLVAEAAEGASTRFDTLNIFVAPAGGSPVAALPAGVRDGINYNGNNSVTLVLRAPGKSLATVSGDFSNWIQLLMNKTSDGKFFWITLNGLTPGQEYAYQYTVDGSIKIADPYAEKVLDPFNDGFITAATFPGLKPYPSGQTGIVGTFQPGAPAYNWTLPTFSRPDKRGLVIYELLVRDFVAAHDWKTIQDSLAYLQRLGVNAIQLMPFNEFEGNRSWGYNPNFYFTPDKYYGPPATLKRFIDSCHRRGIAVIMDIALNHQFGSSPMVQLYYDAGANRPAANNPWFNPMPRHAFNVGFDMNHESPDTKYFFGRVVEHWLQEYKLDGFRFDLSKGFTQTPTCDANGNNCNVGNWSNYDASRVAIWKSYYDTLMRKSPESYVILEHFAEDREERELSDYGMLFWGNHNHNYNQASMGFSSDWDFSGMIAAVRGWSKPHLVGYAESHDEERIMYKNLKFGNNANAAHNVRDTTVALKRAEQVAAFLFTIPGPKMIWQFGELGYHFSINTCENGTESNDCRTADKPIRWDFLADPRRRAVYDVYSRLINLRFHPWYTGAFQSGTVDRSLNGAFKWLTLRTANDTADLVVIGNFDVVPQTGSVTFPTAGTWYNFLGNFVHTATGAAQSFTLQPGEYHVYVNRNVNNVTATSLPTAPRGANGLSARVYPNPAARQPVSLALTLPQSSNTTVDLYSTTGHRLARLYTGFLTAGTKTITLPAVQAAAGTYFLRVTTRTGQTTLSLTLQ